MNVGTSPDEVELLGRLRIALVEAYLSILHGLIDGESDEHDTMRSNASQHQ